MKVAAGRLNLFGRVAVVFLAVTLVWLFVTQGLGSFFGPAYPDRVGHAVRAVLTSALVVPLIFLARRYLDRRSWEGLRFTSLRTGWRWLLFGMVFWLVAVGLGLVVTVVLGWTRISLGTPSVGILLLFLYLPVLVFLYESLPEELIFRGYLYRNLSARYARWVSVLAQATLFTLWGAAIAAAGSVDRVVLFFTFSVALGILRVISGNLWATIGFHLAFQWVTQLVSAAVREGSLQIAEQPTLELVVFWFFPIVLGSIALIAASVVRGDADWRGHDPDPLG
ncbi:MAG: CPBP family intramembrane metalloprotease [Actinomycetota bacterium]|nr:CPBP family intramembrane metalloprotease [Actinomycetota bacterium]